jgi:hypothetical protein
MLLARAPAPEAMTVADTLTLRLAHPGYRELFPKLFASS